MMSDCGGICMSEKRDSENYDNSGATLGLLKELLMIF